VWYEWGVNFFERLVKTYMYDEKISSAGMSPSGRGVWKKPVASNEHVMLQEILLMRLEFLDRFTSLLIVKKPEEGKRQAKIFDSVLKEAKMRTPSQELFSQNFLEMWNYLICENTSRVPMHYGEYCLEYLSKVDTNDKEEKLKKNFGFFRMSMSIILLINFNFSI